MQSIIFLGNYKFTFTRRPFQKGYHFYLVVTNKFKEDNENSKRIRGNSLHGNTERYKTLYKGELPNYEKPLDILKDFGCSQNDLIYLS